MLENGDQYSISEWLSVIIEDDLLAPLPTLILIWKKT